MNLLIFIIATAGMIHLIGSKYAGPKIQDKSTNTKDSVIVKDSLLILNTNDTVRVFNIINFKSIIMSQFDNAQQGYDSYEDYLKSHKDSIKNKTYRSEYNSQYDH